MTVKCDHRSKKKTTTLLQAKGYSYYFAFLLMCVIVKLSNLKMLIAILPVFLTRRYYPWKSHFDFIRSEKSSQSAVLNDDVSKRCVVTKRSFIDILLKRTMNFSAVVRNVGVPTDLGVGGGAVTFRCPKKLRTVRNC